MERAPAKKFEDLVVWQKAHALTLRVYKLTKTFPKEELFGLTAQMRRAAVSVPANIAEGFSKKGRTTEFITRSLQLLAPSSQLLTCATR